MATVYIKRFTGCYLKFKGVCIYGLWLVYLPRRALLKSHLNAEN